MQRLRTRLRASASTGAPPSLSLDFLGLNQTLDSRITFTRGSNATLVDSTGKVTYAPNNLLLRSEEFDNAAWTKTRSSIVANAAVAPNGTTTADKLVVDTTAGTHIAFQQLSTQPAGSYVFSVYAKAAEISSVTLQQTIGTTYAATFDLLTGAVSGSIGGAVGTATAVGNGWYRCSIAYTTSSAIALTGAIYTGFPPNDGTSGIFIWGAQLEAVTYQTAPSTYNATTASAYYGPRFDYDPVTLNPKGLLIEEQRSNLLLQSQFASGWTTNGATTTFNTTGVLSPDGTTNGRTINDTSAAAAAYVYQAVSFTSGTAYTMSVYVKKGVSTYFQIQSFTQAGIARFNLSTNTLDAVSGIVSSATITNIGGGWYRCTATMTATATASNNVGYGDFEAAPTGDLFSVYGAQLEAGAFATSYIPTVASTVTRSADVATMTGTNFSSWYNQSEGTLLTESQTARQVAVASTIAASANDGTSNNALINFYRATGNTGFQVNTSGVSQANLNNGIAITANAIAKIGSAYKANDFAMSTNAGTVQTGTGTVPSVNRLEIGGGAAGVSLNGHIRRLAYYQTRLADYQLQGLTA